MNKKIFLLGIIVVTFMMLTSTVIAASVDAKGTITWINKAGNVGKIERFDDNSKDIYIFRIPKDLQDPNNPPIVGHTRDFHAGPGRTAHNISPY